MDSSKKPGAPGEGWRGGDGEAEEQAPRSQASDQPPIQSFSPAQLALHQRLQAASTASLNPAPNRNPYTISSTPASSGALPSRVPSHSPPSSSQTPLPSLPAPFVAPSSYLRPRFNTARGMAVLAEGPPRLEDMTRIDIEQLEGLKEVREFLKIRTSYDAFPISFRLIMLDTALRVTTSLNIMVQNAIVSAPLWDSRTSTFAGLITANDYINVVQYYWQNPDAVNQIENFRLDALPAIERAIGVQPMETISIHPERPLYEACRRMLESRARRIPLVDVDDETQRPMVVSVITQYRILKFIAVNVTQLEKLRKPLGDLKMGTYTNLATATMDTPVIDAVHLLVKHNISSIPIVDATGKLLNIFESVDIITLIKGGAYDELELTVGEAILKRPDDFPGIHTCAVTDRLDTIMDTIRRSRVHRFIIISREGFLQGVLTLSDILEYLLVEGEPEFEQATKS